MTETDPDTQFSNENSTSQTGASTMFDSLMDPNLLQNASEFINNIFPEIYDKNTGEATQPIGPPQRWSQSANNELFDPMGSSFGSTSFDSNEPQTSTESGITYTITNTITNLAIQCRTLNHGPSQTTSILNSIESFVQNFFKYYDCFIDQRLGESDLEIRFDADPDIKTVFGHAINHLKNNSNLINNYLTLFQLAQGTFGDFDVILYFYSCFRDSNTLISNSLQTYGKQPYFDINYEIIKQNPNVSQDFFPHHFGQPLGSESTQSRFQNAELFGTIMDSISKNTKLDTSFKPGKSSKNILPLVYQKASEFLNKLYKNNPKLKKSKHLKQRSLNSNFPTKLKSPIGKNVETMVRKQHKIFGSGNGGSQINSIILWILVVLAIVIIVVVIVVCCNRHIPYSHGPHLT